MTKLEAQALGELLLALENRVNRLQEALEVRLEPSPGWSEDWLSVSERLAELGDDEAGDPV